MTEPYVKAGERVTDENGNTICFVKNDIMRGSQPSAKDFHNFAPGENPFQEGQVVDHRCVRAKPGTMFGTVLQLRIDGKWR